MGTVDHRVQAAIAAEALDWFVLNRGGVLSNEERAAFGAWLKSSPLHVEEYLRTAVMSQNLNAAFDTMDVDLDALLADARAQGDSDVIRLWNPERSEHSRLRLRWQIRPRQIATTVAAAVLAIAVMIWLERDGQRFGLPKEFETAHGEQRSWLLPDGSSLNLNSNSDVMVHYGECERLVEVERGQALFQVAHEPGRRFRVGAGKTGVIAVGTEFDVLRQSSSTVVTVVQGKVAVFTGDAPVATTGPAVLPAHVLSVSAGEQVRINDRARSTKPSIGTVNVQQTVAWVQHQIEFDRQPLGNVAEEFNRYSDVPIVIQGSRLRDLPISGVFNEYDTDSFLAFIARLDDVEIDRVADRILVVDKSR